MEGAAWIQKEGKSERRRARERDTVRDRVRARAREIVMTDECSLSRRIN